MEVEARAAARALRRASVGGDHMIRQELLAGNQKRGGRRGGRSEEEEEEEDEGEGEGEGGRVFFLFLRRIQEGQNK